LCGATHIDFLLKKDRNLVTTVLSEVGNGEDIDVAITYKKYGTICSIFPLALQHVEQALIL
jgi:hypothetical protein